MKFLLYCIALVAFILTSCENQNHQKTYDEYFTNKGFNGQVYISMKGKIVYQKTFGKADIEKKQETTTNDSYLIGSITKQFTSFGILILEDRGLLSTNDSIGKYFLKLPKHWSDLKIHELLTHSSGIPDFDDLPGLPFLHRILQMI